MEMKRCTRKEAATLRKFGFKIYAEVDEELVPHRFFTVLEKGSTRPPVPSDDKRIVRRRKRARGHIPGSAVLALTNIKPSFMERGTIVERCYISTRDLLAQKKYKGVIKRHRLEDHLCKHLGFTKPQVAPTISQLIYNKKALKVVS